MVNTMSILVPYDISVNSFARYQIKKGACSGANDESYLDQNITIPNANVTIQNFTKNSSDPGQNTTVRDANGEEQTILSLLHSLCELDRKLTSVVFVQRDVNALIAVDLDDRKGLVYTITADKLGSDLRQESYIYWNGSSFDKHRVKR